MMMHQTDLTIDEAMADPMIRTVMKADRVEPRLLESMLRTMASLQAAPLRSEGPSAFVVYNAAARFDRSKTCGSMCAW